MNELFHVEEVLKAKMQQVTTNKEPPSYYKN